MSSLRLRATLAAAGVASLAMGMGGAVLCWRVEIEARKDFASSLAVRIEGVLRSCEWEDGELEFHGGPSDQVIAIRDAEGRLLLGEPWLRAPATDGRMALATAPSGLRVGVAARSDRPVGHPGDASPMLVITVGMPTAPLDSHVATLRWTVILVCTTTIALVAGALTVVLRQVLAASEGLAESVARIDPRRPETRIPADGLPDDLRPIGLRVNELCERLERAYGLATTVHAAAAHELRTPLAGLRATLEVEMAAPRDATGTLAICHGIVMRMQQRVANLLLAARLDCGAFSPRREEVDVLGLLQRLWGECGGQAASRGLTVTWDLPSELIVEADPEALRMILANLLDNAVAHGGPGTLVIAGREQDGRIQITISNPAGSTLAADVERLFSAGWRRGSGDDPRHAGLGMTICRELAGIMDGTVLAQVADGRFTVELTLPEPGSFSYW